MRKSPDPTTSANAAVRLFLRFLLCYLAAVPIGVLLAARHCNAEADRMGTMVLLFVSLALLGAFLTVTMPYLLVLTVCKAFYDGKMLYCFTVQARTGDIGIFSWNACFFLVVLSAVLFVFSAAQAALFAFLYPQRDGKLLFSAPFGRYLLRALLLCASAVLLYLLWPHIDATLGLSFASH